MSDYKFKFSVVIPVYKVEDYLKETVESVIKQSIGFKENIQIILVNDGSPDNSGEICERYQNRYPRNVKYIIKENGGVSSARNLGFEHAEGKYINFLDSDDKWGTRVFEMVDEFFEEHEDEIDVISARVRIFDAKAEWHVLDYKYAKGARVVDITDESEHNTIQLHVTSSFFKKEAIENIRFNESIKFGEDALFATEAILGKQKFGILPNCVHYYRKRPDLSSATQSQSVNTEYYTISPLLYYNGMIEASVKRFGYVIPYVQNILAYDIGWRVRVPTPEEIVENKEIFEPYCQFLRDTLQHVEDKVFIKSVIHKRLGIKLAFYKLKHGTELIEKTSFDVKKKAIMIDGIKLYNFKNNHHSACHLSICKIEKNTLTVEGLLLKWLLKSCPDDDISFVIRAADKVYEVDLKEYPFANEVNFFGKEKRYYSFKVEIDMCGLFNKNGILNVRPALRVNGKLCDITTVFGKLVPNTNIFKPCFRVFGSYIMTCSPEGVKILTCRNVRKKHLELEKEVQKWLKEHKLDRVAKLRREVLFFRKTTLWNKKLWLITERYDAANDNSEAFFKYLSESNKDNSILPVFAISKRNKKDVERLSQYGKVIFLEEHGRYKRYFLAADKIITSSCGEFATNPLTKTERIYLTDLMRGKLVFIQHGIIYNDLSSWLHKYNKNIELFITSAERERESIASGNYMYDEKNVALTGLARYDLLENKPEKKIVILPTWRSSIKGTFNAKSESVYFFNFVNTEYYKFYNSLINDERLLEAMREKGYTGLFCLHPIFSKQSVDFEGNDVFEINRGPVDYKNIFSTSSLLVTDYSSIFFDFTYLRKPVIHAQFDRDTFYEGQNYEQGYFDWDKDAFGPICKDLDSTIDEIIACLDRDCQAEPKYIERMDNFFAFDDKNNCERIYEAIKNM